LLKLLSKGKYYVAAHTPRIPIIENPGNVHRNVSLVSGPLRFVPVLTKNFGAPLRSSSHKNFGAPLQFAQTF